MIENIIFLTPRPINSYEEDKWSLGYLSNNGFNIKVLNLAAVFNKGNNLRGIVENPLESNFIIDIVSYSQFEEIVKTMSPNSLFIDYLVGHSNVSLREEKVFRILKKYKSNYAILSSGALPLSSTMYRGTLGKIMAFFDKLSNIVNRPELVFKHLGSKLILLLTKYNILYPMPTFIFGGKSETLNRFISARKIDKSKVILINSYDFDKYVSYIRSVGSYVPENENTCIFLDEAATHHSDFELLGMKPADPARYFDNMNKIFDYVEKSLGLKVVIAAHPRSKYDLIGNAFHGRKIVKGQTLNLVAKCSLVVMHMSTSVSYAVLFNKPILPIKIPGLELSSPLNKMVDVIACAIGECTFDIEKQDLDPSIFHREQNFVKYEAYLENYVKTPGADNLPEWEIVANHIRKFNEAYNV